MREVLCQTFNQHEMFFIRQDCLTIYISSERRIDRRFGSLTYTLHRSAHCRLISWQKKASCYRMFKFVGEFCARPCPLKYLVNCMTSCSVWLLQCFAIHNGIRILRMSFVAASLTNSRRFIHILLFYFETRLFETRFIQKSFLKRRISFIKIFYIYIYV